VEDFNFGPLRRIRHTVNQQKVRIWRWSGRKNKKYYDRSQYAYENKQNDDKMTGKFADFCAQLEPFLQILRKIARFEEQFTPIFDFRALPCGYLRPQAACRHFPVRLTLPVVCGVITDRLVRGMPQSEMQKHQGFCRSPQVKGQCPHDNVTCTGQTSRG
jgi:hypothetical protein